MIDSAYQYFRMNRRQVPHGYVGDNRGAPSELIAWIETCLESWQRIASYISLARSKKFDAEDEDQFLELKGKIAQELEIVWATGECPSPTKDDVHLMMNDVPSLRYISEVNDGTRRNLENRWHTIHIGWHSTLGQIKARRRQVERNSHWTGFFRKKPSW
jgi:hypothetical protein